MNACEPCLATSASGAADVETRRESTCWGRCTYGEDLPVRMQPTSPDSADGTMSQLDSRTDREGSPRTWWKLQHDTVCECPLWNNTGRMTRCKSAMNLDRPSRPRHSMDSMKMAADVRSKIDGGKALTILTASSATSNRVNV